MASTLHKLGKGLAAGLTTLGGNIKQREDQERKDKLLQEEKAFREKKFKAEREDAETRNELLRVQNMMAKAEFNSRAISNAFSMSGGNPAVMADVWTKHNNDNRVYRYNPEASKSSSQGAQQAVVYDVGTYVPKGDGTFEVDPATGKNIINPLPGPHGQRTWQNMDDWTYSMVNSAHPSIALARENSKITIAETRDKINKRHEKDLALAAKQGEIAKDVSEETGATDLRAAQAEKARAESKRTPKGAPGTQPTVKFNGFGGEVHELTSDGAQKQRDQVKGLTKKYEGISPDQAFKIGLLKDDPEDRANFQEAIADVIKGEDTERDFIDDLVAEGLPRQFAIDVIEDARAHEEEFPRENPGGEKGKGYWDRFWGTFGIGGS